jgi:hypothetical protein
MAVWKKKVANIKKKREEGNKEEKETETKKQ